MFGLIFALIVSAAVIGGILYITINRKITMKSIREALRDKAEGFQFAKVLSKYRDGDFSVARIGLRDEYGDDQECIIRSTAGSALTVFPGRRITC